MSELFEASYVSHEKDVKGCPFVPLCTALYRFVPVAAVDPFTLARLALRALRSGNGKVQLSSKGPLSVNCEHYEGPGHST